MGRGSIIIVEIVNFMFLILGIIMMCSSLYLYAGAGSNCEKITYRPTMILGFVIIVVSFMGLMGACFKDNSLLVIYLFFVLVIIVGVIAFVVFGFVVTLNKVSVEQQYRLEDFSNLLQKVVRNGKDWDTMKTCLIDAQLCENMTPVVSQYGSSGLFANMKSYPIELGCCRPPVICNFSVAHYNDKSATNEDCGKWKEKGSLCFDCESCKVGFLVNLRHQIRVFMFYCLVSICFLTFIYYIGCCARTAIKYRYIPYSPYLQS